MSRRSFMGFVSVLLCLPLTGCWDEHQCYDGEYPVLWPDDSPAMCVKNGETPPPGTKPYPPGQTPSLYPPEKGPNASPRT